MPTTEEIMKYGEKGLYWDSLLNCFQPMERMPNYMYSCPDLDQELPDEHERAGLKRLQGMDDEDILAVREKTYGDFTDVAELSQKLKSLLRTYETNQYLSARQREALDMIASKIARIICGDPNYRDSWDDIIGYARLGRGDRVPI